MGFSHNQKRALVAAALFSVGLLSTRSFSGVLVGAILSGTYLVASQESTRRFR